MTDDAKKEREAVLLPCPLCNAPADIIFNKVGGAFSSGMETPQPSAECTSCKLRTPIFRCDDWPSGRKSGTPTQKEAVAAVTALWNNRQPQTDALKVARDAAIEECALLVEGMGTSHDSHAGERFAKSIRALKESK
jgi:hypothetical protein